MSDKNLPVPHKVQIPTPIGDFMLAWDEMDNRYAIIQLRQ